MGKQLAKESNAAKYLECCCDGTGIQEVFQETIWTSLRQVKEDQRKRYQVPSALKDCLQGMVSIDILGDTGVEKNDLIQRFFNRMRLNV